MKITPGKLAGLKSVSNERNVIAAAAMDQRGSLQKSLSKERGSAADGHDLEVFKTLVTEVLTRYASAILLESQLALRDATPAQAPRLRNLVQHASELRDCLRV